jgi:hypothetical protein
MLAVPASASTVLTFEDGDVTAGGAITTSANYSVVTGPFVDAPASGDVLYVESRTIDGNEYSALFFARPFDVIYSFDIRALQDTNVEILTNGASAFEVIPLLAGVWTSITYTFSPIQTPASTGHIRASGGFYIDNITLEQVAPPAPIPEPSTWLMMIAGFGGVGAAMRRRRVRTTVTLA